jgi:hypothetical protein
MEVGIDMLAIAQKQRDLALKAEAKPYQRIGGLFPIICQKEWVWREPLEPDKEIR